MPSAGHDFAADRLSRASEPVAHRRRLVVPGPAAKEPDAVDAQAHLRVIPQTDQSLLGGDPAAAPAAALAGLADCCLSLGAHHYSRLLGRILNRANSQAGRALAASHWHIWIGRA